jgi:predicted short-subunit dehydrogenase-like oxidoreductase (DUF2520 family)
MCSKIKLAIIGAGKVGMTLAILCAKTDRYEVYVASRNREKAQKSLSQFNEKISCVSIEEAMEQGDIVLLSVNDDAIATLCSDLAQKGYFKKDTVVLHCSGALSSDELLAAKRSYAYVASMHPLQTFPSVEAALDKMAGTYCYYEGDEEVREVIYTLASNMGMLPVEINKDLKVFYHAAAVVACNYLCALMDGALELGEAAGIKPQMMLDSLNPLIDATLENIRTSTPAKALTGPIARGDEESVRKHVDAIETLGSERLRHIYSSMGVQATHLALQKGSITPQTQTLLEKILRKER